MSYLSVLKGAKYMCGEREGYPRKVQKMSEQRSAMLVYLSKSGDNVSQ